MEFLRLRRVRDFAPKNGLASVHPSDDLAGLPLRSLMACATPRNRRTPSVQRVRDFSKHQRLQASHYRTCHQDQRQRWQQKYSEQTLLTPTFCRYSSAERTGPPPCVALFYLFKCFLSLSLPISFCCRCFFYIYIYLSLSTPGNFFAQSPPFSV